MPGTSAYLVVLMPLATLTLILPTYTSSVAGPFYTPAQLSFVALATLALYGVFLYVQTVRHRDYFLSDPIQHELKSLGASIRFKPLWLEDLIALAKTLVAR